MGLCMETDSDTPHKAVRVLELQRRISEHMEDMAYAYEQDAEFLEQLVGEWQIAIDDYIGVSRDLGNSEQKIKLVVNRS